MEGEEISDQFIRTVAVEVRGHGSEYEDKLKEREKSNPKYAFLQKEVSSTCLTSRHVDDEPYLPAPSSQILLLFGGLPRGRRPRV